MKVHLVHAKSGKDLATIDDLNPSSYIIEVKKKYQKIKKHLYPSRQALKKGTTREDKLLDDKDTLEKHGIKDGDKLYFKDLGHQVGYRTVFLAEYAGPLIAYLLFYLRPPLVYGAAGSEKPIASVVHLAAICWSFHYIKRLLETVFVHRFSHATMPIANLFRNCGYYWSFGAFISYFINHPLYTPPCYGTPQIYGALVLFLICEYGNYSIHTALRDLRPPGSKGKKIPYATGNPMTILYNFVSCPNYTYETGAWLAFAIMTQCLPVVFFMLAGFYQMAVWAKGKHRNYKKEFSDYPKGRKAIVPFLL
ncbi:very-long-chain enoyl-CoA reductase-like [Dysidea avara]|uniref:very-long-chain enoyl-CoA reductase-like n=1 Tax=Dysidea avara TaxID=196820 RepID=UPI00331A2EBF